MAKKTINLYLLLAALSNFGPSFIAATYVTFLIARGLNLFEVNLVNFVFFTTLFLSEIPTGAIADVFGRKRSFVISCFLWAISFGLYPLMEAFAGFAFAEAIGAIGLTFATGAFQAWLKDKLEYHGSAESIGPILAKEQQIGKAAGIVAALIGAFLAGKNDTWPWLAGGSAMAITGLLAAILMKEEYFIKKKMSFKEGWQEIKTVIAKSFRYGRGNSTVKFILLTNFLLLIAVQAPNMQWQPFFGQFLPDKTSFGFIYTGISLAIILGSWLAPRLAKRWPGEKRLMAGTQIAIGSGIILTALAASLPLALTAFLWHEIARGALKPITDAYLNDNIPSKERATLISFQGMAQHIGGMIGLVASGFLAEKFGIPATWVLSGGTLIIASFLLIRKNIRQLAD